MEDIPLIRLSLQDSRREEFYRFLEEGNVKPFNECKRCYFDGMDINATPKAITIQLLIKKFLITFD